MYTWKLASPEEFNQISGLFLASDLGRGREYDIQRRITIPLILKQIITFYRNEQFCGFVSVAMLNEDAENRMPTTGISASDWRSGDNFWVIDYIVSPHCDGYKMLRMVTKDLNVKKARYFKYKNKQIREVRAF